MREIHRSVSPVESMRPRITNGRWASSSPVPPIGLARPGTIGEALDYLVTSTKAGRRGRSLLQKRRQLRAALLRHFSPETLIADITNDQVAAAARAQLKAGTS